MTSTRRDYDRSSTVYLEAWQRADIDALVAMLADDASFAMPPQPDVVQGPRRDRRIPATPAARKPGCAGGSCRARANGQLAFGHYIWDEQRRRYVPELISVLTLQGEQISDITASATP